MQTFLGRLHRVMLSIYCSLIIQLLLIIRHEAVHFIPSEHLAVRKRPLLPANSKPRTLRTIYMRKSSRRTRGLQSTSMKELASMTYFLHLPQSLPPWSRSSGLTSSAGDRCGKSKFPVMRLGGGVQVLPLISAFKQHACLL